MTKPTIIYGLYSSRAPGELRYIGQTTQSPNTRLCQHRNYAKKRQTPVHKWFAREVADGFDIDIRVLVYDAIFNVTELEVIAKHRVAGARLLNLTDGGEGTLGWRGHAGKPKPWMAEQNKRVFAGKPGRPMSEENKAKLISALTGKKRPELVLRNKINHPWIWKKHTDETRAKMSASAKGRIVSDETRQKLSGREMSPEWRQKIGDAKRGKRLSEETKEKIRSSMKIAVRNKREAQKII